MRIVVFDTETTGLVKPSATSLNLQPRIVEFAAVALDDNFEEIDSIDFLLEPGIPLPEEITKITGIKQEDVAGKPRFALKLADIQNFFLGATHLVGHNLAFDVSLLTFELQRMNCMTRMPWPPKHICTVDSSYSLKGHRLKLGELYREAFGKDFDNAHRAISDVRACASTFRWLHAQGLINL